MSNRQQNLYSGFDTCRIEYEDNGWVWIVVKESLLHTSDRYFKSAADAEQALITFLKNYEGLRNG